LIPYFKRYVSDGLLITNLIQKSYDQIKIYIEENKYSIFLLYKYYILFIRIKIAWYIGLSKKDKGGDI